METKRSRSRNAAIIGILIVIVIVVAGTLWMGHAGRQDTDDAVRAVSLLYLDELAGRREQVVHSNLQGNIETINVAVSLMSDEDLSDDKHLQDYQKRIKALYDLERFAFVGESGTVYTSSGTENSADSYPFDPKTLSEPEIHVINRDSEEKKVIIAAPVKDKEFQGDRLAVCFMQIDMAQMLEGVSMHSDEDSATFCNLYTTDGYPLSNAVLGGFAKEDNLIDALKHAEFEQGYSLEKLAVDFGSKQRGVVSFEYNGRNETLAYIPVEDTDWILTYLIRESLISDRISPITQRTLYRSVLQSILTIAALVIMFLFILSENRRNAKLMAEHEAAETEARVKQEELAHRLELQEELLAEKAQGEQQDRMINALSSDYRSVYYLELDKDRGVCYQARTDLPGFHEGEKFNYLEAVTEYCNHYVTEPYREAFLEFIQPDNIRKGLKDHMVIAYRYLISIEGNESWEVVKFAGVRHPDERDDHLVHNVSACFADVDDETRTELEQKMLLTEALETAEQANKAKTAFLSSMSHEIRTPMNAIIGLDNIALNDPETPEKTKDYLRKIGASAEHLLHLINDILDMSRIESGRMVIRNEEFAFSELLETVNTMFSGQCADKGLDYHCRIKGDIEDYYVGDMMKIRQVLINILGNAVKFTPEGGKVELSVEKTAEYENQSMMRFTIADTGIGMSKEYLPKLFDTFTQEDSSMTNKYGSSGLGMAITRNIVEMMNGSIEVESEKGVGSTFRVTVPLMDAGEHEEDSEKELRPDEMTVLVVDDDPVACEHAKLVLEKTGIAAEIAMSGPEAIEKVTLRHARRDPYNLILVDWKMPDMDGVETTRRMRDIIGHESAIIILTAYRWDDVFEEALSAGVDSFLPKPLFASTIMEEFRTSMRRKGLLSPSEREKAELAGRHILLAEDVQINAEIMMMVLAAREISVDLAENGRIAVEKFEASEPGYYDAVLMDMRMPEMDGLEATRTIRAMEREDASAIPIIALTANAFDEDVQRSLQAGLNAHLTKPVQPESLYETLESLIKD